MGGNISFLLTVVLLDLGHDFPACSSSTHISKKCFGTLKSKDFREKCSEGWGGKRKISFLLLLTVVLLDLGHDFPACSSSTHISKNCFGTLKSEDFREKCS